MTDSPSFTPVPLRARADGWTPERQRAFLDALAATGSVDAAARAAGMSRASAYRLRGRPDARAFAAAWDAALVRAPAPAVAAKAAAAASLHDRAFNGRLVPIMREGRQVGFRIRPDNVAAMALLRRYDRACRGRDG